MVKCYHKLIRDKIPQIIEAQGKTCVTQILSQEDYVRMLEEKLSEEVQEYLESKEPEELADLLEVMEAVAFARGYSWEEILKIQAEKRNARGGFQDRLLLKEVHD